MKVSERRLNPKDNRAEILADEPDVMPVYLLHGHAIENVPKYLLIHRYPKLPHRRHSLWT
jgi:hypothetical protein